ncbi:MAG: phosphate ABC transporter permease PstA [Oligoflexus sp.]
MFTKQRDWVEMGFSILVNSSILFIGIVFVGILAHIFVQGAGQISWEFLLTEPSNAGRAGGIAPILVATLMILAVCLMTSLPLGLATAILLAEYESQRFVRWVRQSLEVLAGVPSIVFGLFGNAFFSKALGLGFSILSGGLTLACMVLPIFIRIAEEGFRQIPSDYRRNAAALGFSRLATLYHLLLPAAMPSIVVGLVLGIGRALAETAALIFTSGYVDRMPESWLDSGRALSIHIYDLSMNVPGGDANAYATSLILILLLIVINSVATGMSRFWSRRRLPTI